MGKVINKITFIAVAISIVAVAVVMAGCQQQEDSGEIAIIGREVKFPDGTTVKCATAVAPNGNAIDRQSGVTCDWVDND